MAWEDRQARFTLNREDLEILQAMWKAPWGKALWDKMWAEERLHLVEQLVRDDADVHSHGIRAAIKRVEQFLDRVARTAAPRQL